ncbi:MAG: MBL fold metallo-hydrolase, partial [Verrucomicrobiae bacterium]|nr:MBL fold metallo-hydrolase [Verrucomicrobiae bacterium]
RVRLAYSNYLSIDALRWYFKDEHILAKARRVLGPGATIDWLPMAETRQLPTWVIAISNARLVVAADGSGFLIDCGSREILARLTEMKNEKKLVAVEDVFVTHYHDDHTELLPVLVGEFGARIHACGSLVNVLEHPGDYRLPCLTRNAVSVTARHRPGQSWRWKEFKMTIYDFPGQTVHHNALLVQRDNGEAILFVGDSFTPSGIDDYCLQNRNILRNGEGYLYCLGLVERLPSGCWLVNQHVEPAFRFTREQLRRMRQTLETRKSILAELLPYDDPNFGLDEGWCTFYPYATEVRAGDSAQISVRITNHSPCIQSFEITIHGPEGWVHGDTRVLTLPPATEGAVFVTLSVPSDTTPGLRVITADVSWGNHDLRHWAECLVEVKP